MNITVRNAAAADDQKTHPERMGFLMLIFSLKVLIYQSVDPLSPFYTDIVHV
jgi:hypothetical protein